MSKLSFLSRYFLIVKRLKAKPYSSLEELQAYIERQGELLQTRVENLEVTFSQRTFQRDVKDIKELFGFSIEFSRKEKGYFITNESESLNFQRMVEAFEMFNSLNIAQDLKPYLHLETRLPQGTENLYGLLHAIKNKLQIRFDYQKFWEDDKKKRNVEPYALKEFKNRWYLMAKNQSEEIVKSFALDRLTNLEITNVKFETTKDYDIEEAYRYCFGIVSHNGENPQEIVLSFDPFQGKYIKSLPLHPTQEVVNDDEEELLISLKLCITHDFIMELLSHGDNVMVIKPSSLALQIKAAHRKAFEQY